MSRILKDWCLEMIRMVRTRTMAMWRTMMRTTTMMMMISLKTMMMMTMTMMVLWIMSNWIRSLVMIRYIDIGRRFPSDRKKNTTRKVMATPN